MSPPSRSRAARGVELLTRLRSGHLPEVSLHKAPPLGRPLRIVNITGLGRSGSTLLGQLLAEHPDLTYVGEIHKIWQRSYLENALCSCRKPFHECPFWSEVDRFGFDILADDTCRALQALERHVVRKRLVPRLLLPGWPRFPVSDIGMRVTAYRERLYQAILAVSGTPWVLDAGKDPVYGLLLSHLDSVELHVIHIVRDPRAVAHSWQRPLISDDLAQDFPIVAAGATASAWLQVNTLADVALRRRSRTFTTLRYEDLISNPTEELGRIMSVIGLPGRPPEVIDHQVTLGRESHFIAGNPRRRTGGLTVRLSLDDEWRHSLSPGDRRVITLRCRLLMRRYGYT